MNSHFNFLAPFYDRVLPFARLEQTLKVLDLPHAGILLDAGGGTGRVFILFLISGIADERIGSFVKFWYPYSRNCIN